jgi:hypothetical protein
VLDLISEVSSKLAMPVCLVERRKEAASGGWALGAIHIGPDVVPHGTAPGPSATLRARVHQLHLLAWPVEEVKLACPPAGFRLDISTDLTAVQADVSTLITLYAVAARQVISGTGTIAAAPPILDQ